LDGSAFPGSGGISIGPHRVIPLSWLATQYPQIVSDMRLQLVTPGREGLKGQFVLLQGRQAPPLAGEYDWLLQRLASGPRPVAGLADESGYGPMIVRQIEQLVSLRVLQRSCFTPTDALHVVGRLDLWDAEAATVGARLLASRRGLSAEVFCERVIAQVSNQVVAELVTKVLSDEARRPDWESERSATELLARAIGCTEESDLDCQLALRHPVVAVGAPVGSYLPRTADLLSTDLVIPPYAEVANAVGAVAGGVVQRLRVLVRPMDAEKAFRAFLPHGVEDFRMLEPAVARAQEVAVAHVEQLARDAGADHIEVHVERIDHTAPVQEDWGHDVYVETELLCSAVGRPGLAPAPVG
jgi:N-methylhydantoinase A/oxoprolinase/acetone carboxylase beta subunit